MSSLLTASRDFEEKSKAQQQLTEERLKAHSASTRTLSNRN
ncbi:hypothetical protein NX026_30100 [Klebsiella pneumoniae]|nr:hypothetical protein [Klebsiella pneumoniae]